MARSILAAVRQIKADIAQILSHDLIQEVCTFHQLKPSTNASGGQCVRENSFFLHIQKFRDINPIRSRRDQRQ